MREYELDQVDSIYEPMAMGSSGDGNKPSGSIKVIYQVAKQLPTF